MGFTWDPEKARLNVSKHGVDFADAVGAFEDPRALTRDDPHPTEERSVTLGFDLLGRLVVVSWTWDEDDIRPISARVATPNERRQYHAGEFDA